MLVYISLMFRKLTWGLLVALVAAIVVFVASRKDKAKQRTASKDSVTAPVTHSTRQWVPIAAASDEAPPPECAPLAEGGFTCGACRDDSSCPPGQSCVVSLASKRTECQGSECAKNDECQDQKLCRVVGRNSRGEPIRGCVAPGLRQAGAPCESDNAGDPSVSCSGLLVCVQGGCAPSCVENEFPERNACVGEVPCVKTDDGWACVPTCKYEPKECRDGKVCEFLS